MSTHLGQFSQMCSLGRGIERRWSEGVAPGLLPMAACGSQPPPPHRWLDLPSLVPTVPAHSYHCLLLASSLSGNYSNSAYSGGPVTSMHEPFSTLVLKAPPVPWTQNCSQLDSVPSHSNPTPG